MSSGVSGLLAASGDIPRTLGCVAAPERPLRDRQWERVERGVFAPCGYVTYVRAFEEWLRR